MAGSVGESRSTFQFGLLFSSQWAKRCCIAALLIGFTSLSCSAQEAAPPPSAAEAPPALEPQPVATDASDDAPDPFSDPVDAPFPTDDPFGDSAPQPSDESPPALPPAPNYSDAVEQTREIVINLQNAVRLTHELNVMLTDGGPTAAAGAAAGGQPVAANGIPMARKVHAIILADDRQISGGAQNQIAVGAASNATMISELLQLECSVVPNPSGTPVLAHNVVLDKTDFDFRKFRSTLNSFDVADNDVLFVYFACHGLTFIDSDNAHGFQMPGFVSGRERTPRRAVWDLMKAKGARQTILISDSCANGVREVAPEAAAYAAAVPTHALAALLLFNVGDVDINGCSRPPADHGDGRGQGEFGIYDPRGGFFTVAFRDAALHAPRPISWHRLFMVETQSSLNRKFPVQVGGIGTVSKQTIQRIDD